MSVVTRRARRSDKSRNNVIVNNESVNQMSNAARRDGVTSTTDKINQLPILTIKKSVISLLSQTEMINLQSVKVDKHNTLDGNGSVNDPRMGDVSLNRPCQLCKQIDCPGHFGYIEFKSLIYNPVFIKEVAHVLSCVCNDCAGLLITEDTIREKGYMNLSYEKRLAEMKNYCVDIACTRTHKEDVTACKKNPVFITTNIQEKGEISYKTGDGKHDSLQVYTIERVYEILNRISIEDARLMGFPKGVHPRNMIMAGILVPPIIARPPVIEKGQIHYDQLVYAFKNIVAKADEIKKSGSIHGAKVKSAELYPLVKQLIFKTEGKKVGQKDLQSIIERIQGKKAIMRELLMGKRVNYCARTVAGPDNTLKFGQIRIPRVWRNVLTKKIRVTNFNYEELKKLLEEGKITHIISARTSLRRIVDLKRKNTFEIGDVVERWLQDGDRMVINRQPTLHAKSMMAYRVVLGKQLTIGLHLSYTTPMNCDFDGDENNAWAPQDFEVDAEIDNILNVKLNIISAEQNKPTMGLVMNSISGAYILTDENIRITDTQFQQIIDIMSDRSQIKTLYKRLERYGVHPRSGHALFSTLLPEDFYYDQKGVLIIDGVMISGRLTKSHLGTSHRSIIQDLHKKYGAERTAEFMTDAPVLINKWLIERGFSVGISDCINLEIDPVTGQEYDKNERILAQELAKIYVQIDALGGKVEDQMEESYRLQQINNLVNIARGIGLRLAKEVLVGDNAIAIMTDQGSGAKGGIANIGQMFGSVGQQYYRGQRLKPTISNGRRLLPVFDMDDNDPVANAFIAKSLYTGLSPEDLFNLQAGGREGILDTALKVSDTGHMQRRMGKAFENIVIGYDGSIRNTIGTLFSPLYNSGYDVAEMIAVEHKSKKDFTSFIDIQALAGELNSKRGWVPEKTFGIIQTNVAKNTDHKETILPKNDYKVFIPIVENLDFDVKNVPEIPNIRLTKFEKARLIGARATQLSHNASPLVDLNGMIDPVDIATKEYNTGTLGINGYYIIRKYPDGTHFKVAPTLENI